MSKLINRLLRLTCLSLLLTAFIISPSYSRSELEEITNEKKLLLSVIPFKNITGSSEFEWIGSGFSATIESSLNTIRNVTLIDRQNIKDILNELAFSQSGYIDQQNAAKLGKLSGSDYLLVGNYQVFNGELMVTTKLIDVEK